MTNVAKNYEVNKVSEISISYKSSRDISEMVNLRSSIDARDFIFPYFENFVEHHEEVWVLLMNRSNKCLGIFKVSQGGITDALVDVRIVMQVALKANATSMILCHNHPSGNATPSSQDDSLTRKIKSACTLFDIHFLDHLIITSRLFYSYADEGRL